MMFFLLVPLVLGLFMALYMIVRLIRPLAMPRFVKIMLGIFVFVVGQKLLLLRFVWPYFSTVELPTPVLLCVSLLYVVFIILFLITFVTDSVFVLLRLIRVRKTLRHTGLSVSVLCALTLSVASFGMWQALSVPKVREVVLSVPNLESIAPGLEGFRIAHLTDIHLGPLFDGAWLLKVVLATNATKPDLVVLTGDIIDDSPANILEDAKILGQFKAPYGIMMALGNHEYISNYAIWLPHLRDIGLRVLLNEHAVITHWGSALVVAGVTDPSASRRGAELPNPQKALQGAPKKAVRLMLAHQPKLFEASVKAGADIQLSGHTHGGTMFFLKPLIAHLNAGFVHGLYMLGDAMLYVNAGAGLWDGFPIRLGVPSEIVVFTLQTVSKDKRVGNEL